MTVPAIRVIIADDHPVFRHGLRALLEAMGLEVVGEASRGDTAISLVEQLQPDVVLMDLQMPGISGIEATRRVCSSSTGARVCVLTMHRDDDSVFAAIRAGALGYVLKGSEPDEIERAVRSVAAGQAVYGPDIAKRVIAFFSTSNTQRVAPFPELTDREREILKLVAAGMSNLAISNQLYLSPKTIRNYISNILSKLQLADRSAAIVRAREAGLRADIPGE